MINKFKKGSANIFDTDDTTGLGGGYEEGPDMSPTGGEDYNPNQGDTLRRRQQLENLLSGNPSAFIDENLPSSITTGGQSPELLKQFGPKGSTDAVVFEAEQSRMLASLEDELDVLKRTAATISESDLDLPMGAIETERFERAARQQKVAKKLGKPVKAIEVKETPADFKDVTVRQYYEGKVSELEGQIEIEKMAMGDAYEKQARDINLSERALDIDPVEAELTLSDEALKKRPSKGAKSNITNVGGSDVARPRGLDDIAAATSQVSKKDPALYGTFKGFQKKLEKSPYADRFKDAATKNFNNALNKEIDRLTQSGFKGKDIIKTATANLNKQDITVAKLKAKYEVDFFNSPKGKAFFGEPRLETAKIERYSAGLGSEEVGKRPLSFKGSEPIVEKPAPRTYKAATEANPRYLTTGLGPEFDAAVQQSKKNRGEFKQPVASTGATDRTRAKFKSKYGGGNVAAGSKNVKAKDLPSAVLEQTDEFKKVYGSAIARGFDEAAAVGIAMKAVKSAKSVFKKNPVLMPITEFYNPLKTALENVNKKKPEEYK